MPDTTRHLVDPELLGLLDAIPPYTLSDAMLPIMRARPRPPMVIAPDALDNVEMTERMAPGPKGAPDVRMLVYRPRQAGQDLPCILHIHGGGYIAGSPDAHEDVHRAMALELGCVLASVDYRLAPETRAPGSVEDCYAALAWLVSEAATLGIDPARMSVMGESAGGGLAAALALLVRDRGEYQFTFQHLIYPMLDDRTCITDDPNAFAGEFIWTPDSNRFGWASLLGLPPGGADVSAYAAPARAIDLAGLPPTYIAVGALDLFVDENLEFARRLIRAGVPTELHVYPGAFHGFHFNPAAGVTLTANRDSLAALKAALARA